MLFLEIVLCLTKTLFWISLFYMENFHFFTFQSKTNFHVYLVYYVTVKWNMKLKNACLITILKWKYLTKDGLFGEIFFKSRLAYFLFCKLVVSTLFLKLFILYSCRDCRSVCLHVYVKNYKLQINNL